MSLRNTAPLRFSPKGLSDSLDETDQFPGACASLQNLIPDPSTENVWTCRPASVQLTDFPGFNAPGAVSVFRVFGNMAYGFVASSRFAGCDEPFAFNLLTNAFQTVYGATAANCPLTQPTTGAWVPPTIDQIGTSIFATHPGFGVNPFYYARFDLTAPNLIVYSAGDLPGTGFIESGTIVGGAGYVNGVYPSVTLTGGTGSSKATIQVSGGAVIAVIPVGSINYTAGDVLSASNIDLGGAGAGFTFTVDVLLNGKIQFATAGVAPAWVRNFNGRAWFGVNTTTTQPAAIFTDTLTFGCSNANQVLTFGDNLPLVAAAPLGLSNQLGGIVQALMIFKDDSNIVQVTGDYASSNLSVNTLNVAIGTAAPRAVASTPNGLAFLAPDGFRLIGFDARVSDPLGAAGSGVVLPFINAVELSRIAAACNGQVLRVSAQNGGKTGNPWEEYWYDLVRKVWSGPHTFPSTVLDTYAGEFVVAPQAAPGKLFSSVVNPSATSIYNELGIALAWTLQTVMLADNLEMAQSEIAELQVKTGFNQSVAQLVVTALDQNGSTIASATYGYGAGGSIWGSMVWGEGRWGGLTGALAARRIDFSGPVVYNRLALRLQAPSAFGLRIGDIFLRRRLLGYLQAYA